jgi:hypothetical protein
MAVYLKEEDLLLELRKCKEDPKHSKEALGEMFISIANNMTRMPSFSNYSDLWKADMISNAVMRCLLYYRNFDESKISKRTNKPVKAFAYLTEICFKSFVEVINQKRRNEKIMERSIEISQLDEVIKEYGKKLLRKSYEEEEEIVPTYYVVVSKNGNDIKQPEEIKHDTLVVLLEEAEVSFELFEKLKRENKFENLVLQKYSKEKFDFYKNPNKKKNVKDIIKMSDDEILKELGIESIDEWANDE